MEDERFVSEPDRVTYIFLFLANDSRQFVEFLLLRNVQHFVFFDRRELRRQFADPSRQQVRADRLTDRFDTQRHGAAKLSIENRVEE
jgi:hypothetical protein